MGAYHDVNALYYVGGPAAVATLGARTAHPDDKAGFAVGGGLKLNAPMIGQGDYLQAQVNYTQGALKYIFQTPNSNWGKVDGSVIGFGVLSDAVFGGNPLISNATNLQLTTGWNVNAAYEHFWNEAWRTSVYGGYAAVRYNANANAQLCSFYGANGSGGLPNGVGAGSGAVALNGCDNDWDTWWIGSRTQWNVTKDFYMGVDVLYQKLQTANLAQGLTTPNQSGIAVTHFVDDVDNFAVRFRVHRDFYP